ncbi:MAG: 50S ribosomal protein L17 [Bacteroidales bacterium]|nr:50S ribosomal protein L17 [Bacteroidales bacterium]
MRHNKSINHLGRTSSHRKAMLSNMSSSLILHKRITTTVAKAKALKKYVEPLITKAKNDTTHNRRVVFSYLEDKNAVSELFREVVVKVGDRPGGYTRILRTGSRLGDNADMCIIELVDYNEAMLEAKEAKSKTSRRSRRSKSTAPATAQTETTKKEVKKAVDEAVVDAKDAVEDATVVVENNVEQVVDAVEETVEQVADVVEETVAEVAEGVTDAVESVEDTVEGEAEENKDDEEKK